MTNGADVTPCFAPSASSVSIETPSQCVSNFDHLVTQWMSVVRGARGSA